MDLQSNLIESTNNAGRAAGRLQRAPSCFTPFSSARSSVAHRTHRVDAEDKPIRAFIAGCCPPRLLPSAAPHTRGKLERTEDDTRTFSPCNRNRFRTIRSSHPREIPSEMPKVDIPVTTAEDRNLPTICRPRQPPRLRRRCRRSSRRRRRRPGWRRRRKVGGVKGGELGGAGGEVGGVLGGNRRTGTDRRRRHRRQGSPLGPAARRRRRQHRRSSTASNRSTPRPRVRRASPAS